MPDSDLSVTEDELHAYVDCQLPADRLAGVEAWLASHPKDAARVGAWRAQREAIHAHYGEVAKEPIPERLTLDRIMRRGRFWAAMAVAASMCAFIVGGISGWTARGPSLPIAPYTPEHPTNDAQQARPNASEVPHPVTLPSIEHRHMLHSLTPKRANYEQRVPNLEQINFKLVGAGLLPGPTGPTAFFIHEGPTGDRYTLLYSTTNASETSISFLGGEQTGSVYWIDVDRDLAYVAGNDAICRKPFGPGDRL